MINIKNLKIKLMMKLALLSVTILTLPGCATIFGSNERTVKVASQPSGAQVFVENSQQGVTPAIVSLPTYIYGGKNVVIKKEGYRDQYVQIRSKFQPVTLLNLFFWPGFIIDAATGTLVKVDPVSLNIYTEMEKVSNNVSE